jgi:hypothetical protein
VRQCKAGEEMPCIRIAEWDQGCGEKKVWYVRRIKFLGETVIKQMEFDANNPNNPFIYIETNGPIEWEK